MRIISCAFVLLTVCSPLAMAQTFSDIFVFGDSLSDVGNVYVGSEQQIPPSPPYYEGRFSNGPVWVERLATSLGLNASTPSLRGGNNFAFGGAQTGDGHSTIDAQIPNIGTQIDMFVTSGKQITSTDLVVLWAGHNDIGAEIPSDTILQNLQTHVSELAGLGGQTFLIPNLFEPTGLNAALTAQWTQLASDLNINIVELDFRSLVFGVLTNPQASGITNPFAPACPDCENGATQVVANPDSYLFWDNIHPTAVGHQLIANSGLSALRNVPEPNGMSVMMIATMFFSLHCRRKQESNYPKRAR
ncbi:MAG: SGNH/GDSL hydrolase family protein [Planctomycetales bacterium]|nr:SGNH/GDSL hydrolase family protein [Planctomycetales bacterium]